MVRQYSHGDTDRLARILQAVARYQRHPWVRTASPVMVLATNGAARLLDFGGSGRPAMFVPSLVNPSDVLDLADGRSMLRWMAASGVRTLLVDWGTPQAEELAFGVGDYVTQRLLPLIAALDRPVDLVGYCLGGTMALAAVNDPGVKRVATIAAPWDFSGYAADRRAALNDYWLRTAPTAAALGKLPMDFIQPAFWGLDPAAVVGKFERFHALDPDSTAARLFVALEDWANDGPPLALPAARDCFEMFFKANAPASGRWHVGGAAVDPASSGKPIVNFVSDNDRIVPAATAPDFAEKHRVSAGHVGMIAGSAAEAQLWRPLAHWLRR